MDAVNEFLGDRQTIHGRAYWKYTAMKDLGLAGLLLQVRAFGLRVRPFMEISLCEGRAEQL